MHGGRHREPGVERRHRGVGAERESTPASIIQRNAKQRSARSGQIPLGHVAVVEQWAGWTLARTPSPAIRRRRRGGPAARARSSRGRPSPRRRRAPASRRVADRVRSRPPGRPVGAGRTARISSPAELLGRPWGYSSSSLPGYSAQHHAVRVFSEPSVMILSGPIGLGGSPARRSPVRSPTRSRRRAVGVRRGAAPGAGRRRPSSAPARPVRVAELEVHHADHAGGRPRWPLRDRARLVVRRPSVAEPGVHREPLVLAQVVAKGESRGRAAE